MTPTAAHKMTSRQLSREVRSMPADTAPIQSLADVGMAVKFNPRIWAAVRHSSPRRLWNEIQRQRAA